jgi:hypothetical protein
MQVVLFSILKYSQSRFIYQYSWCLVKCFFYSAAVIVEELSMCGRCMMYACPVSNKQKYPLLGRHIVSFVVSIAVCISEVSRRNKRHIKNENKFTYVTLKRLGKTFSVRLQKNIAVLRHRCSSRSYRTYWQDDAVNVSFSVPWWVGSCKRVCSK